ncbi:MAG: right-handed parallel beta-helix repeat-containing protein [Phycisphaerae bacterium]|nr:right-handed parallel beta-helix repeat-containing protein [Phycisphaerae bacterium]
MMSLQQILDNPIVNRIGFAIMHSLWQCTVIAILFAVVMVALRNRRAQVRYNAAVSALLLMVIAAAVTVFVSGGAEQVAPAAAPEGPVSQIPAGVVTSSEMPLTAPAVVSEVAEAVAVPVVTVIDEPAANASSIGEKIEIAGPYLAIAWIVGVLVLSVWHLGGWAQLRRLRRVMVKPVDDLIADKLARLARSLAVKRTIEIVESALVTVPTVIGAFKPVVLLPASALTGLSAEQLEMILAHELAHIKRNDYLVNLIQTAIDILLFYHPAAWYVSRKIRAERENCCDDIAVRVTGDSLKYARALTTMEEIKAANRRLAVAATGGNFFDRIARLVGKEESRKSKPAWQTVVITMLVIFAAVLPLCFAMNTKGSQPANSESVLDNQKYVPLVYGDGELVLAGKKIKSFEDLYFALAEIKERSEKIFQVTLSDPSMKADDVKRTKTVLVTWARDLKFKEVVFTDEVTIDKSKAAEVIAKWWRATRTGDVELMRQAVVYDNDEQLAEFTKLAKSDMFCKGENLVAEPILVDFRKTGDRKCHVVLIVSSGKYNTGIFYDLIVKDGDLKLDIHIKEVLRRLQDSRTMSAEELGIKEMNIRIVRWKNAEGQELAKLVEEIILFTRNHLLISKYAIEHKIDVAGAGSGFLAKYEENLKKLEKMTPAQIRDMILKEFNESLQIYSNPKAAVSLQSIIDNAKPNTTVTVPKGIYTEPIKITKPLTLKAEAKGECVLEVTANDPALFIDTASKGDVTVEGITIKWKLATSDRIEYASAIAVKDCKATIKDCVFAPLGNFRQSPTAARAYGFSKMYLDSCQFDGFDYTVCFSEGTEGVMTNCVITKCKSQGIILYSGASADVIGNYIANSGKHAVRSTGGKLNMLDNLIVNNANRGVYLGNRTGSGRVANNVLIGNGVGISGFASANVIVENNVILKSQYAAIAMRGSCRLKINDNIIQDNPTGVIVYSDNGENNNTLLQNTFYNNKENTKDIKIPANTIIADPLFKDAKNGDLSLKSGKALENKQGLMDHSKIEKLWKLYLNSKPKNE